MWRLRWPFVLNKRMRMEPISSWTLTLLRLLSALPCSWTWSPARTQYALANGYLNAAQRPLWILEDELIKRARVDRSEAEYGSSSSTRATRTRMHTHAPPTAIKIVVREDTASTLAAPTLAAPPLAAPHTQRRLPHHLQLPSHYIQQRGPLPVRPKTAQRRRQAQSLPIFDSSPGDNALSPVAYPIFVYNGTKGELLVNTMLSAQRYPMQEPVPGQVLYPPSTPMFRPKPIVERFRLPDPRELLNLTLIPFYAHEAIAGTPGTLPTSSNAMETAYSYPSAPVPLSLTTPLPTLYETQLRRSKRRRKPKRVRQYNAYRSPQEVMQRQKTVLRSSAALVAPDNHRHYLKATTESTSSSAQDSQKETQEEREPDLLDASQESNKSLPEETTTATSSSSSSSTDFQIVYLDESETDTLDSSTPAPLRQSSRYALQREYYAFPIYTLGKLLRDPSSQYMKRELDQNMDVDVDVDCIECSAEQDDKTWFVLNSRYKGPYPGSSSQRGADTAVYTSKYMQSSGGNRV